MARSEKRRKRRIRRNGKVNLKKPGAGVRHRSRSGRTGTVHQRKIASRRGTEEDTDAGS